METIIDRSYSETTRSMNRSIFSSTTNPSSSHMCGSRRSKTANMKSQSSPATPPAPDLHLLYAYAQKLNNNAALCIEHGHYNRAESTLKKALGLSKAHIEKTTTKVCNCYHCTLDGCITFTEDSNRALNAKENANATGRGTQHASPVADTCCSTCHSLKSPQPNSYIYRQAIRTPCLQISDGHNMGPALSLIIAFNLGLARHLIAVEGGEQKAATTNTHKRELLEGSLRLYEVAYKCLKKYHSGRGSINNKRHNSCNSFTNDAIEEDSGIQFKIILCNNLCHVHGCLNNTSEHTDAHRKHLEALLSSMMCVVERKVARTSSENDSNSSDIDFLDSSPIMRFIDLEGFWKTVSHLVLTAQCADPA